MDFARNRKVSGLFSLAELNRCQSGMTLEFRRHSCCGAHIRIVRFEIFAQFEGSSHHQRDANKNDIDKGNENFHVLLALGAGHLVPAKCIPDVDVAKWMFGMRWTRDVRFRITRIKRKRIKHMEINQQCYQQT